MVEDDGIFSTLSLTLFSLLTLSSLSYTFFSSYPLLAYPLFSAYPIISSYTILSLILASLLFLPALLSYQVFFQLPVQGTVSGALQLYQISVYIIATIVVLLMVAGLFSRVKHYPRWLLTALNLLSKGFYNLLCGAVVSMLIRSTTCIVLEDNGEYRTVEDGYFSSAR